MLIKSLAQAALAALLTVAGAAQAATAEHGYAYMSLAGTEPFDQKTNLMAMDAVFADGWDRIGFDGDFSNYVFVYIDGNGAAAGAFDSFLASQGTALAAWVHDGGRVLITGRADPAPVASGAVGDGVALFVGGTAEAYYAGGSGTAQFGLRLDQLASTAGVPAVAITTSVPEPQTCALMLAGLGAVLMSARRRRAQQARG